MKYYKEYQEWLDEIQPIENGLPYSILLERGDPIAFNCGYDDYLNSTDQEDALDEKKREREKLGSVNLRADEETSKYEVEIKKMTT